MDIWKMTLGYFKAAPNIFIPFFVIGVFDVFLLLLIYLAPQRPLSIILAPPIRAFWGEQFLHYPVNLLLIPRLFNYAHTVSTAIIGVLMTGLAVGMLSEAKEGSRPGVLVNLIRSVKRYLTLIAVWLITFGLMTIIFKVPQFLHLKQTALSTGLYVGFLFALLIEVIFIYTIPVVMLEKKKLWPAIKKGLSFSKSKFLPTLILIIFPTLIYIPLTLLGGRLPFLMNRLFPEVVLIFMGLGIIVSLIVDCLITCSTTVLFLNETGA